MDAICWLTQTSAQIPANLEWLGPGEREVLTRFQYPKRRGDWLLGRWTAKQAVCRFLKKSGLSPASLEIRADQYGAPEVFHEGIDAGVSISLSHSRDWCICAVSSGGFPIGCDLEWIEPREEYFAADYFTAEEMAFVCSGRMERALAVDLIWSAKESALKVLRRGLSLDTRSVVIRPEVMQPGNIWNRWNARSADPSADFYGWWRAAGGFVIAIASDHPSLTPAVLPGSSLLP